MEGLHPPAGKAQGATGLQEQLSLMASFFCSVADYIALHGGVLGKGLPGPAQVRFPL